MNHLQTTGRADVATMADDGAWPPCDVVFRLDRDAGWPPFEAETISCEPLGDGTARLLSVPRFARDVSRGDIVTTADEGALVVAQEVALRGGNSTVHVRAANKELLLDIEGRVEAIGIAAECELDQLLLAVDVPCDRALDDVLDVLDTTVSAVSTYTVSCHQHASWRTLAADLRGRVVTPGDDTWDSARTAWNLAVDQHPAAVVFAADARDIAAVIRFARGHGLRVAPQGGGHNPTPLGDLGGTILLRTSEMKQVSVFPESVRCEAGVLWGDVNVALTGTGRAALAGSSHDVGVVGYALSGGYSWLSRSLGLASSSVIAIEVVTGDGVVRHVDADHDPELFWALRGGGGNHGIVSALTFRTFAVSEVYAGALLFPIDRAREVFTAYEKWTRDLDESVTSCVRLLRMPPLPELPDFLRGQSFVVVDGAVIADPDRAEQLLAPLRELGPAVDLFTAMPPTELAQIHMDPPTPTPGIGGGLIIEQLPDAAIDAILDRAGPAAQTSLLAVDVRHLGGAIARPATGGGAVACLPGRYLVFAVGVVTGPEARVQVTADVDALTAALAPWASARAYANFSESPTPADRFHDVATLRRLRRIQRHYDPTGVIRANHPLT